MRDFRLKSLEIYNNKPIPTWGGADLSGLDIDNIITYIRPDTDMKHSWDDVPEDIKITFELLGIPQAERESLAGVGAQYDSEVVYHNIKQELIDQGIIYTDMETALKEYEDVVKEYFMKLIPPQMITNLLHSMGGLFGLEALLCMFLKEYRLIFPLQSYFRLNAPGAGQFEHTLIIVEKEQNFIL